MTYGIVAFALFWVLCGLIIYDVAGLCVGQKRWWR